MDRTQFAGLTTLNVDDPLSTDDAAFLDRNIRTIDHFIGLGAKFHRHDGHPALVNPVAGPTVLASAGGGSIDPATTGYFGVTLVDGDGGETLISPLGSAVTPDPFLPPTQPPHAHADYTGGNLRADTYYYGVTLLDGLGGETTISPYASVVRQPGYASGQVYVTDLDAVVSADPGATGWAVYRSQAGGQWSFLASGVASTYIDNGADCADCLREPPFYNTTRKTTSFAVTLPAVGSAATAIRLYGSSSSTIVNPGLIGTYPAASAGAIVQVPVMSFANGSPPPVSTSVGGAEPISGSDIQTPAASSVTCLGAWTPAGSGWASPTVSVALGFADFEGAFAASAAASGDIVGQIPPGGLPRAHEALDGLVISSPRGRVAFDVLTNGMIVLAETPSSPLLFLRGRWRL